MWGKKNTSFHKLAAISTTACLLPATATSKDNTGSAPIHDQIDIYNASIKNWETHIVFRL
jgi:hypothetical protein